MARSSRRLLVGLAVVLPAALLACQGLIGLDEFQKGECPGAHCGDGGTGGDVINPPPPPPPPPLGEAGPPGDGAAPVSWAHWKMPNYGEGGLPNPPSYTVSGGDGGSEVTDTVTGLVWQSALLPAGQMPYASAQSACKAPWRLPKRIELVTLVDYSAGVPTINQAVFPGVLNVRVWTSSEVRGLGNAFNSADPMAQYWYVDFNNGQVASQPQKNAASVLCVKGQ